MYEANVNYSGFKPVTATVGYFHPFVSLEDATFPGDLLFLERPSIISIERSVAAGIQRASLGAKASTEDYFASVYLTGPVFGAQKDTLLNGEQLGLMQGEYYQIGVTRSKLSSVPAPRLGFNGGYVGGSWVLTGEPHPYDAERAAWARPKVDHPFSLEDAGMGARELAAHLIAPVCSRRQLAQLYPRLSSVDDYAKPSEI